MEKFLCAVMVIFCDGMMLAAVYYGLKRLDSKYWWYVPMMIIYAGLFGIMGQTALLHLLK